MSNVPPNTRVQRTRSSASPPRSPLTRSPLGRLAAVLTALLTLTGISLAFEPHMPRCKSGKLRPAVDHLVTPVLKALKIAESKNDWWDKAYEASFYSLIEAKGADAKEARVALLAYYVGEHYGEELVCAVEADGKAMIPLLERYKECRPRSSAEPVSSRFLVAAILYDDAIDGLKKGEKCK